MERREKKRGSGLNIVDIPKEILCVILLKLPAWSIRQCSCLCTTFRDIISDSQFKQLYSSEACLVLFGLHHLRCIDSCYLTDGILKQSQSQGNITNANTKGLQLLNKSRFITLKLPRIMDLVNSSNGLVCFRELSRSQPHYNICNPLLGEIVRIPPAPTALCDFSAFGFDPKSKHYKILQLVHKLNTDAVVAELYQSGDDKWIVIENAPTPRAVYRCAFDLSLNGALHWLPCGFLLSNSICSFDLHTNEFKSLPFPSHFDVSYLFNILRISVGVLKGCLCLCYATKDGQFETWLMEEYGMQESWTKVFTIDMNSSYLGRLRPIGFSSSGDMWFKDDSHYRFMVSYSAEAGVFRQIDIGCGPSPVFNATSHVFSFVSLKDIRDAHPQIEKLPPN